MTAEQWGYAGATVALAIACARAASGAERRDLRHPAIVAAAALFLIALVVRAMFVEPTLVHADLAAPQLVDCMLQFPQICTNRGASYGQYGFWLIGALAQSLGGGLEGVFRAMQVIGALDVALLAVLAYRLSGSPYGALLAVAVTATNPVFMRVAASEDMHNLGLCLGLVAFIGIDVFAVGRRKSGLVVAVLALSLMIHTRQTFHVFAPCAFLLALARGGREMLKNRWFWASGLIVLGVLLARVRSSDSSDLVGQMSSVFFEPLLLPTLLRNHALFDWTRFGPLPALTVAALVWACLANATSRTVVVVFAANFLVTYPCGMPSPGVELAQRLSAIALGMLLVAMGGAALLESRLFATLRVAVGLSGAVVLFLLPPFFPGWRAVNEITPIHREYLAVEAAAQALPQEITLVMLRPIESASFGGARYAGLLERQGVKVATVWADEIDSQPPPRYFLENIECWTYSFYELIGIEKSIARKQRRFDFRWDLVLFGREPSPVRPPAEARPECRPLLRRGTPLGPRQLIRDPADDAPFLFYATNAVPVQFHRLGVSGDDAAPRGGD